MVEDTQTICWKKPTNCLSMFDHFVGLALKELLLYMFELLVKVDKQEKGLIVCNILCNVNWLTFTKRLQKRKKVIHTLMKLFI